MKTRVQKSLISAITIGTVSLFLFPSYTFFVNPTSAPPGSAIRWKDGFPHVNFMINPKMAGYSVGTAAERITAIASAAAAWFEMANAKFSYTYKGGTAERSPHSPAQFNCTDAVKESLLAANGRLFAAGQEDPDCTGPSCTMLWSCGGELLHFDIQMNDAEFDFNPKGNANGKQHDLFTVALHQFGHATGLSHCGPGVRAAACATAVPLSEPKAASAMFRYVDPGRSLTALADEDGAGLRALYGEFANPFPRTGRYALSSEEIEGFAEIMTVQHEELHDTPEARQEQARMAQETFAFIDSGEVDRTLAWVPVPGYSPGMTARQFFDASINTMKSNLNQVNDLQLEYMKRSLSAGHIVMDDLINKYEPGAGVPDESYLRYINARNDELRRAIIDEQVRRGL